MMDPEPRFSWQLHIMPPTPRRPFKGKVGGAQLDELLHQALCSQNKIMSNVFWEKQNEQNKIHFIVPQIFQIENRA